MSLERKQLVFIYFVNHYKVFKPTLLSRSRQEDIGLKSAVINSLPIRALLSVQISMDSPKVSYNVKS